MSSVGGLPPGVGYQPPSHQYLRAGAAPPRSFGDRLSFDTGVSYLTGLAAGSSIGMMSGWRRARQQQFTGWLMFNQVLNGGGKIGSSTANSFAVFALTYNLARDIVKYKIRDGEDEPINEAIGAGVAATMQGLTRFSKVGGLGCGLALGSITYLGMKYGMDTIKKIPFDKL